MPEAVLSDGQTLILTEAEAARRAAADKPYTYGGSTTEGFDCSGFVVYVFNQAYGTNTLARVTADDLRTGGRFPAVSAPAAAGDLVFFFSEGSRTRATHVGIVASATKWIGSQTSTGVAARLWPGLLHLGSRQLPVGNRRGWQF